MTDKLCRAAWNLFQEIEAAGGAATALEQGLIQAKVALARAARERALADKNEALIGASEYPGLVDVPVLDVPQVNLAHLPAAVTAEPEFIALYGDALEEYGHTLTPSGDAFTSAAQIGAATAIELGPRGRLTAVSEPVRRGGGSALVVRPGR